jgi:hypothetical protein
MWPDPVDEILGGDQAVALAHVTPARGVVLTPVTNFALRNRASGTVTVNSSVGMWRKLERIRQNPSVAVAFHTREHAVTNRPEYVLVQGRASLSSLEDRDGWLEPMGDNWARFGGQPRDVGPLWGWWLSAYHWRVNIEIAVERVVVWPDLACTGTPEVHGTPRPAEPPQPQRPPAGGTGPRIDHTRASGRAASLPHVLLGWVGTDELPVVVPVDVAGAEERGIVVEAPAELIPPGGRRAGLLAHWFSRHVVGQRQRKHTGWLDANAGGCAVYAPHTETGYTLPAWRFAYNAGAGFVTRRGLREARRTGFLAR